MDKHITMVATFQIGLAAMGLLAAVIVFVSVVGGGLISQNECAIAITSGVGIGVSGLIFIISLPGLIGGLGLLKRRSWSRILLLIVSVLNLPNIPIGTAIACYTIWVLMKDETVALLEGGGAGPA